MFFIPPKSTHQDSIHPHATRTYSYEDVQQYPKATYRKFLLSFKLLRSIMASVAVARFGGALRSSGAVSRTMRTLAGPSPLARGGWVRPSARCMSTVYAESHEYLVKVSEIPVCVCAIHAVG